VDGCKPLVPGLFDSHVHLVSGGFRLAELDLSGVTSKAEFKARVKAAAAELPAGQWLLGRGLHMSSLRLNVSASNGTGGAFRGC